MVQTRCVPSPIIDFLLSEFVIQSAENMRWYDCNLTGSWLDASLQSLDLEIGQGRSLENVGCDCSESRSSQQQRKNDTQENICQLNRDVNSA